MDWIQVLTNLLSVGTPMAGAVYIFYSITTARMDKMESFHREDMRVIKDDLLRMDEKWERLFEKLLLKEQGK